MVQEFVQGEGEVRHGNVVKGTVGGRGTNIEHISAAKNHIRPLCTIAGQSDGRTDDLKARQKPSWRSGPKYFRESGEYGVGQLSLSIGWYQQGHLV